MARPSTSDRRKSTKAETCKPVGLLTIRVATQDGLSLASASCGWEKFHRRRKVVEDRAEEHARDKHGGMAIWL